jgi:hypothetical protein
MIPPSPNRRDPAMRLIGLALFIDVAGMIAPLPLLWQFFNLPAGAECRPVSLFLAYAIVAIGTPLCSILLTRLARATTPGARRQAKIAAVLSLVPPIFYFILIDIIIKAHHLTVLK